MLNLRFPNGRLLEKGLLLFSTALLSFSHDANGQQEVIIASRAATGGVTSCPAYCETGAWGKTTAGVTTNGSRYSITNGAAFSVTPTLAPGWTYQVYVTHVALSCSPDIIVDISTSGGSGLPASTTKFQKVYETNWWLIGTLQLDSGVATPTIRFAYSSGIVDFDHRFYADAVRFLGLDCCGPTPGPLSATVTATNVTLNWSGVYFLQYATNLASGFSDVPGPITSGPYSEFTTNACAKFYRLRR